MTDAEIEILVEANKAVDVKVPLSILLLLARVDQVKKDLQVFKGVVAVNFPMIKPEEFESEMWVLKMSELDEIVDGLCGKYVERYEEWVAIGEAFKDVWASGGGK